MVVAAILHEISPESRITLIESDQRKSTFLRTVNRELGLNVFVKTSRIEDCPESNAQIVSARALAPLPKLLGYVAHHLNTTGTALLQKGQSWEKEVADAQTSWKFIYTAHKSVTDPSSVVLEIKDIEHV
ncbi:rRNA small subunit methyltransferase G [Tropicibacter naphthalenivorans]|uniref:16S rRNA methyltransferase GidB n=2 Tax=Tropicibacter naphthalenivorans TaxID=441103 RepID=A0A0P1GE29_9RHOB|nr:16S rRNA methyltransferase GidB [Tropicibacter naphthalenivorans]SMC74005.1 rRNA small subunit methyltransferase G [Tropicibacter naphthalenivorans]